MLTRNPNLKNKEIDVDLIKGVLAHIEGDKRRLFMRSWGFTSASDEAYILKNKFPERADFPDCKTKACFAGWTYILTRTQEALELDEDYKYSKTLVNIKYIATDLLGLTWSEADSIFYDSTETREEVTEELEIKRLKQRINTVLENRGLEARV